MGATTAPIETTYMAKWDGEAAGKRAGSPGGDLPQPRRVETAEPELRLQGQRGTGPVLPSKPLWGSILPPYRCQLLTYCKQHPKVTLMDVQELVQLSAGSFLARVVASRQRPPPTPGPAHRSSSPSYAPNPQNSIKSIK